jgi:chromosome partitioning protein
MTRIYAFANQKGGVGKTTTTVNLSAYLAAAGRRVLVVDADPQANATSSLGIDVSDLRYSLYDALIGQRQLPTIIITVPHLNLDLAPSTPALAGAEVEMVPMFSREHLLRKTLQPVLARYDYIFIDCPPSLALLTVNALTAAQDGVIIPIQCEYLALEGLGRLWGTIRLARENLNPQLTISGMVLTMFDARTKLAAQVVSEVRRHFPKETFNAVIPRSVRLSEAPSYGRPILSYAPTSAGARAYAELAQEFLIRAELSLSAHAQTGPVR